VNKNCFQYCYLYRDELYHNDGIIE